MRVAVESSGTKLGSVLVTGGAGFIGCALSEVLSTEADRWVVLDSLHPQVHDTQTRPPSLHESAELVVADVTDARAWDDVLRTVAPDTIVHLAAETGTAQSLDESTRHAHVNVVGTATMLDALSRAGHMPRHVVLSSSRAVYGEGEWSTEDGVPFSPGQRTHAQLERHEWDFDPALPIRSKAGRTPPAPTSVYGATKLAQENLLAAWTNARDVALTILRLQNVYGPGQSLTNSYTGIVALFSRIASERRSIPVYEDGSITRDFVYIDDTVNAFSAVLRAIPPITTAYFDVGSGTPSTILELAAAIAEYHDAPAPRITGEFRDGDVRYAACEVDDIHAALGWRAEWSLHDGIGALQEWIASRN